MNLTDIIENVLIFLAGTGVFITGLKLMSESLEENSGGYIRKLFAKVGKSRLSGLSIGIGSTILTQSSSATTVMLVGLANSGIVDTFQIISIIMGANIGTTLITQIIALSEVVGAFNAVFCALAFFGSITCLTAGEKGKKIGNLLCGLGLIFTGLYLSANATDKFSELSALQNIFSLYDTPFVMFLAGLIVTMIVQSSTVTTGMLLGFIGSGLMNVESALYAIMGANIGTCITAVLASVGGDVEGKKVAFIHLAFNVIGTLIFSILMLIAPIAKLLFMIFPNMEYQQIATFHIVFNVLTTLILIPFVKELSDIIDKSIESRKIKKRNKRSLTD